MQGQLTICLGIESAGEDGAPQERRPPVSARWQSVSARWQPTPALRHSSPARRHSSPARHHSCPARHQSIPARHHRPTTGRSNRLAAVRGIGGTNTGCREGLLRLPGGTER